MPDVEQNKKKREEKCPPLHSFVDFDVRMLGAVPG
jgi:hypothetical protein